MKVKRVANISGYTKEASSGWSGIQPETVTLMPTPVAMQPTEYIRVSWQGRGHGEIAKLLVSAVHDGETAAVLVQWKAAEKHPKDAVAIALPVRGNPPLVTMGVKGSPINMLHWMANTEGARSVFAEGIGTTAAGPEIKAGASASWKDGVWSVVITRALGFGDDVAPLIHGKKTGIGFAVWEGANQERAGIKAFTVNWLDLILDA